MATKFQLKNLQRTNTTRRDNNKTPYITEDQSRAPSIWDRLPNDIAKVMEKYHNSYHHQRAAQPQQHKIPNREHQRHRYLDEQQQHQHQPAEQYQLRFEEKNDCCEENKNKRTIIRRTETSKQILRYDNSNNKQALSSYLSSLESFKYKLLLPSTEAATSAKLSESAVTLFLISMSSVSLPSTLSSSLSVESISAEFAKEIHLLKNPNDAEEKTMQLRNIGIIDEIQLTADEIDCMQSTNKLFKLVQKHDDVLYEKKFDVSDCAVLVQHHHNNNIKYSFTINSSYHLYNLNFFNCSQVNLIQYEKTSMQQWRCSDKVACVVGATAPPAHHSVTTKTNFYVNLQIITKVASNANADNTIKSLQQKQANNLNNDIITHNTINMYINHNNNAINIKNVIFPVNFCSLDPINEINQINKYNKNDEEEENDIINKNYDNINSNLGMHNINYNNNNNNNNNKEMCKLKNNDMSTINYEMENPTPTKNTTILPTRLKFNNINNKLINFHINNTKNTYNLKFDWCCWQNLNFIFLFILLMLIGLSSKCLAARQDVGKECTFPQLWEGTWFLSGYQQSIHIKGSQFSYRGKCKAADGNKYLIVDEKGCHRCLVIYEKHKNVLQYKESECEGDSMYMDQSINPAAMPMRTIVKSSDSSHSHLLNIRGREAHPNSNGHSQFTSSDRYIMRSNDDNNDCFCRGREILQNLCDQIPGDALLFSLFREQAEPVKCPLRGPFTFTYNRGHGECKNPVSNIESCTDESRLLLNFQACPDVHGTESAAEELTCLATWKDGNSRYLVGLVSHHHAISNEERYRCFVYEKISTMMGGFSGGFSNSNLKDAEYKLAQSGDATCNGLDSAEVGSRIMTLRKPPPAERCDFPTWFKGPRHWHGLMGKSQYTYHQGDGSLIIKRISSNFETRAFCEQINKQTSSEMMAVVHHTTECQSGFMCMMFYRRDTHIAEIQLGAPANRLEDACAPDHFDITKLPYITLLSNEPTDHTCPLEGLYKLHGAIGPPHKVSRHKRNHNNKGHNQHGHHHMQQQYEYDRQLQHEHELPAYNHNKRNVEHEFSSASLALSSSSGLAAASSSSSSSPSASSSGTSTSMSSSGIKRHGTFTFQNANNERIQDPPSQMPPSISAFSPMQEVKAGAVEASAAASSSLDYDKNVYNGITDNNRHRNSMNENSAAALALGSRQTHTNTLNIRRRRDTPPSEHYHRQHLEESPSLSSTYNTIDNANNVLSNLNDAYTSSNDTTSTPSDTRTNTHHNTANGSSKNGNSNNSNKEIRFNKKLIKDIIQMQKSLKTMSGSASARSAAAASSSRRHEVNNEMLSTPAEAALLSAQSRTLSSTNLPLSDGSSSKSAKNTTGMELVAHQSKIEILNQRSRRDTPGCVVNYKDQRYLTIGCNDDKNVIEVETKQQCDLEGDEVYYCHGHWSENGTVYVIAKNSATSHAVCITYQPQDGVGNQDNRLMIVGDSCLRGQMKPSEHHLVATIKKAGKCGDPSSSAIKSINSILILITVVCTTLSTYR